MTPQCQHKHTHIRESDTSSIHDVPEPKTIILCFAAVQVQMRVFLFLLSVNQLLISCKGWKGGGSAELQPTQRESERADLGFKLGVGGGQGRGLWEEMGSGRGSRGRSTFSHLYSPKVQSSSFMGWNSGSVCASSFSLTGEKTQFRVISFKF